MRVCPNCKFANREGEFFCDNCGAPLSDTPSSPDTNVMDEAGLVGTIDPRIAVGTARFSNNTSIVLQFRDQNKEPVVLESKDEWTIGRYDGVSPTRPMVDLTSYGAYEKGVSRLHSAIRRGDNTLVLVDLGSSNGTFINGQRLLPNQPRVLRDGDEVRFGKLTCNIYFKRGTA